MPPSFAILHFPPDNLLRPFLVLLLVGIWWNRIQLRMDAVCQPETGEEAIQLFFVAEAVLSVEESEQELLLFSAEFIVELVVCSLHVMSQLDRPLRGDVEAPL